MEARVDGQSHVLNVPDHGLTVDLRLLHREFLGRIGGRDDEPLARYIMLTVELDRDRRKESEKGGQKKGGKGGSGHSQAGTDIV